jgi:Protein of unknown function (DUF3305)
MEQIPAAADVPGDVTVRVAVVLERVADPNPWEAWRFQLLDVVPDEGGFGQTPRKLLDDGKHSRWLYPAFELALFPDECKGYFLNLTSGVPSWFVSWREHASDADQVEVTAVSVSYIEADRRMAAEERVESVPLAPELCEWLQTYTNRHFKPEGSRKQRAQSFLSPEERQRRAAELQTQNPQERDGPDGLVQTKEPR